jgi:hypothetical protein
MALCWLPSVGNGEFGMSVGVCVGVKKNHRVMGAQNICQTVFLFLYEVPFRGFRGQTNASRLYIYQQQNLKIRVIRVIRGHP